MSTAPICGSRFCPFTACPQCIYQGGVSEDVSAGQKACRDTAQDDNRETMETCRTNGSAPASLARNEGLTTRTHLTGTSREESPRGSH